MNAQLLDIALSWAVKNRDVASMSALLAFAGLSQGCAVEAHPMRVAHAMAHEAMAQGREAELRAAMALWDELQESPGR